MTTRRPRPLSSHRRHGRLLAAGLIAGLGAAGTVGATAASAAPTPTSEAPTVPTGARQAVVPAVVSPAALPAVWETGSPRRTTTVTLRL